MTRYTDGMAGPITFDDARAIVSSLVGATWAGPGTFDVADYGSGDAEAWHVVAGAREADADPSFARLDDTVYLVDRTTGRMTRHHYLDVAARLDRMDPIGQPPDD